MTTYGYSGSIKTIRIDTTGTYDISAFGGAGGANVPANGAVGGSGEEIEATFALTKGEMLEIIVGNAGGSGYAGGGGGGGASEVLANIGPNGTFVPLLVAGGGGGAGSNVSKASFAGHAATFGNAGTGTGGGAGAGSYSGAGGAGAKANGANGGGRDFPHGGFDVANGAGGGYGSVGGEGGFGGGGGANFGGGGGGGFTGGNGGAGSKSSKFVGGYGGYGGYGGTSYVAPSGKLVSSAATSAGAGQVQIALACYVTGTRIRTVRGQQEEDVAVEVLRAGDLVVTASGARRPIRWIGHRDIDCRTHPCPRDAMPVRIAAHAFGPSRPARDLHVSPGHAICVDVLGEVLMPAAALVNGATITRAAVTHVTYWHVELDSHDVILAENLPAESYLDCGNRAFFAEAEVTLLHASPDARPADRRIAADHGDVDRARRRPHETAPGTRPRTRATAPPFRSR